MIRQIFPSIALLAFCLSFAGCGVDDALDPVIDTSRPEDFGFQKTPHRAFVAEGKRAYQKYCVGCHGETGEGNGEAARFLNPPPRNFVKANYKFMSTRFGEFPTDEDLFRSITKGLRGSAMPSWDLLPEQTRWALVEYIKSLSEWEFEASSPIPQVTDPYIKHADKNRAIQRGESVYHGFFTCWNCHPAYVEPERLSSYLRDFDGNVMSTFRSDLHRSAAKETSEGDVIHPPDFLRDPVRAGVSISDLYRSIGAGITGTAMPTWVDVEKSAPKDDDGNPLITAEDIWATAYYVQDLIKKKPAKLIPGEFEVRRRKLRFEENGAKFVKADRNDG